MRRLLLLTTTILITITLLPSPTVQTQQPTQTQQPEKDQFPKPETYPEPGPNCKNKFQLAPWLGMPGAGPGKNRCLLTVYNCQTDQTDVYQSAPRDSETVSLDCSDYERAKDVLAEKFICCDKDSSDESKRATDKKKCSEVTVEVSRASLVQTSSTGNPEPRANPAFKYAAATSSGSSTATYSTTDVNANPNFGDIKAPASPSTGEPTPGGLAELAVSYTCEGGDTVTKKFNVATFGLSCYVLADENDWILPTPAPTPTPPPTPTPSPTASPSPMPSATPTQSPTPPTLNCKSQRIGETRYSGVTTNPTGLPPGDYCTSFLADVRLQGSGTTRDGTKIKYVDRSGNIPNWAFKVVTEFTGADNTALIPFGSVARDRSIVPRSTTVKLESGSFVANDTGNAIRNYRLDIFGGTGQSACAGFKNRIEVGSCDPGIAKCPELKSPIP